MNRDARAVRPYRLQLKMSSLEGAGEGSVGFANGFCALGEECFFFVVEIEFNYFFDAVLAEDTGHADANVGLSVFAFEVCGAGNHAFGVVDNCIYNACCCGAGSVPCGGTEQTGKCSASYHGIGCNFLKSFCGKECACGNTAVCCIAGKGYHCCVAVSADYDAFNFCGVCFKSLGEEVLETCAVKGSTHADDAVLG